jgi:hypothetical protein
MSKRMSGALLGSSLFLLLASCGPLEVKIGAKEGVRPVRGTFQANLEGTVSEGGTTQRFRCGDTITATDPNQSYVVTSEQVNGGCQFNFDQDVEVFNESDYEKINELRQGVRFLNRVELTVYQFDLYDEQGNRFDFENRVRNAELYVNGTQIIDVDAIRALPKTVVIKGEAIAAVKRALRNKEACTIHVRATVTILDTEQPRSIRCDYDSQPTYVLSSSEL